MTMHEETKKVLNKKIKKKEISEWINTLKKVEKKIKMEENFYDEGIKWVNIQVTCL